MTTSPLTAVRHPAPPWRFAGPRWLRVGAQWLGVLVGALALALLWLRLVVHAAPGDMMQFAQWLLISGVGSLGGGALAFWLVDRTRIGGLRLKFAILSVLVAVVVGINTLVAAQMMFISVMDAQMLAAFLIFGVSLALVLSATVSAPLSQAIQHVSQGARHMAEGDYSVRLHAAQNEKTTEIAYLVHGFNHMATQVEDAFARRDAAEANRRQVMAAISHDVRTPLTVMRAMLEAIDDGMVTDPETIRRYHSAIRGEMQHLTMLIDDLFEVSRIEAGAVQLHAEPLAIEDLLSDLLAATHEQAEQHQIALVGQATPDLPLVWGDARQLYRVLTNLLQNALRYTAPGGQVAVSAHQREHQLVMQIIDTGAGIAARDLPLIFEPAYRGEASRQRLAEGNGAESGAGLGLAIARGLVAAHGGTIQALSPLPADLRAYVGSPTMPGTAMIITLPTAGRVMQIR